ncbi:SMI1/KNR4 family protein [Bacillus sp. NP157]|nr:SMI1/KNR4 family protein [Bacillus sp. NP157]
MNDLIDALLAYPWIALDPPPTPAERSLLERRVPVPLPADVDALLAVARGFSSPSLGRIDVAGASHDFEFLDVFPHGVPVAACDGNFWVVDVRDDGSWGQVFFVCHDPAVVVVQCLSLRDFLLRLLDGDALGDEALALAMAVWDRDPVSFSGTDALASGDVELAAFAGSLDESFDIVDLRAAGVGDGFAWGRAGPTTSCRRHASNMLFGVERPRARTGWLSRLRGRFRLRDSA